MIKDNFTFSDRSEFSSSEFCLNDDISPPNFQVLERKTFRYFRAWLD